MSPRSPDPRDVDPDCTGTAPRPDPCTLALGRARMRRIVLAQEKSSGSASAKRTGKRVNGEL